MHPASTTDQDRARLAAALRACAGGLHADEAACELIINHATWLHRRDFSDDFMHTGISITDPSTPMASIDWTGAITALDTGHLPCSGESRMLRIAASLAAGIPVSMRDTLVGLDTANSQIVLEAIAHATGHQFLAPVDNVTSITPL
jgi:hypothetical protein